MEPAKQTDSNHSDLRVINYDIKEKLGSGSFSDVYRAIQKTTGQDVAIKILRGYEREPEGAPDRKVVRFQREMKLCSKLHHPNIVRILDSGETERGQLYIAFEFVPGETIASILKQEGALTIERTKNCMTQVLDALIAAHSIGIVHRDLKPENIMLTRTGGIEQIKILDFGLSTWTPEYKQDQTQVTMTQEFLGTPIYASPEQLRGNPVTIKSDLYAWGFIFLECITGNHPLKDQSIAQVIQKQLSTNPVPLPAQLAEHPLGTLLKWVTEKNMERRAGDGHHILTRLRHISIDSLTNEAGFLLDNTNLARVISDEQIVGVSSLITKADQRRVTVLCCSFSLEGDTKSVAANSLDEILFDSMNQCRAIAQQYEGLLHGISGDRMSFIFGYPLKIDFDARCAARAALHISNSLIRRNAPFSKELNIHLVYKMSIHSGFVSIRKERSEQETIFGLTIVIASQLCTSARPGQILTSGISYELLKNHLECEHITSDGNIQSTGDIGELFQINGERYSETLSEKKFIQHPMFGRRDELERLLNSWKQYQNGVGTTVLVYGDPGIGKSRFVAEFTKKIQGMAGSWVELYCIPEMRVSALYPIINFLKKQWRLGTVRNNEHAIEVIKDTLKGKKYDQKQLLPILCSWFGIPCSNYKTLTISPQRQKELLLQYLMESIIQIAQENRSVIILEDLHWADPTSLECISLILERVKDEKIFMIMTARKQFTPSWDSHRFTCCNLNPLVETEIEHIISYHTKDSKISKELLATVIMRADGIPLYAEELVKMLAAQKTEDANQPGGTEKGGAPIEIPATLKDLLVNRLDRLGSAKGTAQLASVLGRTFTYSMISKISLSEEALLLADLDQMVSADIVHINYLLDDYEYYFHHALIRETAYESLPSDIRKQVHTRIALLLESENNRSSFKQPELLANQWAGAQEYEKAVSYGRDAAEQSFNRSLYSETILHTHDTIQWNKQLPETPEKIRTEFSLNQLLLQSLIVTKGYAVEEVVQQNEEAGKLSAKLVFDLDLQSTFYWRMVLYSHMRAEYEQEDQFALKIFKNVEHTNDIQMKAAVHTLLGQSLWYRGMLNKAEENLLMAIDLYDVQKSAQSVQRFGHDTKLFSVATLALLYCTKGLISRSEQLIAEAFDWAHILHSKHCIGLAMAYQVVLYRYRNDRPKVYELAKELEEFTKRHELQNWSIMAQIQRAWAEDNKTDAEFGVDMIKRIGVRQAISAWELTVAQIEYNTGETENALQRVNACIENAIKAGELYVLSEMYRTRALCILSKSGNIDKAIVSLEEGMAISKKIGAELFTTRAAELRDEIMSRK